MTEPAAQPPSAESIEEITRSASAELDSLADLEAVDQWRVSYLGRRGTLTTVLRGLSSLAVEDRRTVGALANEAKTTHTSPMQARVMEGREPPIRVVVPGKCYRYEATDATHEWHFYQVEGLAVGEGITFADLKGTLYEFARRMFGEERQIRFRCDYFPFVEPGVDMSIDCFACDGNGEGCRICRDSGWIEIMGAGMIHPKVLEGVGYDTEKYTGFAFGMGPERIAMLKYGIDDIRHFYANDLRFLQQF